MVERDQITINIGWWVELNRILREHGQAEADLDFATCSRWMGPRHAADRLMLLRELGGPAFKAPDEEMQELANG